MPKSKPTRTDRTKRSPRDPSPERERESQVERAGVVEEELDELDTDKYEPPPPRS